MAAIVREALAEYAAQHMGSSKNVGSDPLEDLIGCFEGEMDLSSSHDDHLYPKK